MQYCYIWITLFLTSICSFCCASYNLSIIHFSDFHARYEPVDNISTTCEGDNCIGGFSKLYATIKKLKHQNPNYILLNAGDNFQGTLWYMLYKWNVTQHFLNKLPLDAITIGNHEFDQGIDNLVQFLHHIQAPVVVSNIVVSLEPRLHNLFNKSLIIVNNNKRIGIIGVLTTSTKLTSNTGKVIFKNELDSVNYESQKLENDVFTNIVLSHCGYELDLQIAKKCSSKISVIVGGHTDTFLYSGDPVPGPDKPEGPYPTIVRNENGNNVLVVHASAYTKYLGNLMVTYDDFGRVVGWDGAPIFLGPDIKSDPQIDAELAVWKKSIDLEGDKVVGNTVLTMLRKPCRSEECLLGNFATDAMIFNYEGEIQISCNYTTIAMIHAGGMRAGIDSGNISFKQLTTTFPFQDTINRCKIQGGHIKEILESVIDDRHLQFPHLLQLAGLRVVYNITKPEGHRIQSLKVCCKSYIDSECKDINLDADYTAFLPTFLTDSNFNPLFRKYIKTKVVGSQDLDVYLKYLKIKSPLKKMINGRILIIQ